MLTLGVEAFDAGLIWGRVGLSYTKYPVILVVALIEFINKIKKEKRNKDIRSLKFFIRNKISTVDKSSPNFNTSY